MEDKTSLWNTKQSDLTVGDVVKLNILAPVLVVGTVFAFTIVASTASSAVSRFRQARQSNKDQTEEK